MTPETQTVLRNQPSAQPATIAATVNGVNYPANASGDTFYQYFMLHGLPRLHARLLADFLLPKPSPASNGSRNKTTLAVPR